LQLDHRRQVSGTECADPDNPSASELKDRRGHRRCRDDFTVANSVSRERV
jgi:hypothetical protein